MNLSEEANINAKLAKIENLSIKQFMKFELIVNGAGIQTGWKQYNPLENDALAFQLIAKYHVEVEYDSDLNFVCSCDDACVSNESLNVAVCLAIIKAKY